MGSYWPESKILGWICKGLFCQEIYHAVTMTNVWVAIKRIGWALCFKESLVSEIQRGVWI